MVSPLTASSKKRRGKGGGPGSTCVSVGERGSLRVTHHGGNHELGFSRSGTHI